MKSLKTYMQEAYDTVPIHPYWGGPPTPDNTEINPYFTTDFYQAMSGGGDSGGDGGGGGASMAGIEAEEEMNDDDFSIEDGDGNDMSTGSFKNFLGMDGGCGDGGGEEHPDAHQLKGGWILYRIGDEENYGQE